MASIGDGIWTTQLTTVANTNSLYTNLGITPGYVNAGVGQYVYLPNASFQDPLAQQAKPRPESNEAWLRRRVQEVCWKP